MTTSPRFLFFAVLLLFFGSGFCALIYEVLWYQLLRFVIGSSAISLGVLLASFMGGMALGSYGFFRFISHHRHPLRVYALLELGIGICGVVILQAFPLISQIYLKFVGYGFPSVFLRALVCLVSLLPPAILMGATLPAISRWLKISPKGISQLGFFYSANIVGAVFGCLSTGFYWLRFYDVKVATWVAVTGNFLIALMAYLLAQRVHYAPGQEKKEVAKPSGSLPMYPLYVAIAFSGMTALAGEVIWTRLLSDMLGGTVYTFSIILSVYLMGLGLGSCLGSVLVRFVRRPYLVFGCCQVLLVICLPFVSDMLLYQVPTWQLDIKKMATDMSQVFINDFFRAWVAIFPATLLWGASFPLALAALKNQNKDLAQTSGKLLAFNTLGGIIGSSLAVWMIPTIGTHTSQRMLVILAGIAASFILIPFFWKVKIKEWQAPHFLYPLRLPLVLLLLLGGGGIAFYQIKATPVGLIGYGRKIEKWNMPEHPYLFVKEGISSSVAVQRWPKGVRQLHISGKVVASTLVKDMRLQRVLGHLPALIHPRPKSVLIVGCGAGVTAGSFVVHPEVERIVICEIEPVVAEAAVLYFSGENHHVLQDKRTEIIFDDARHFLATTKEKFDIITSDPIHPWVKGASALYSVEYYDLCKKHLKLGGIVTQWVPLYDTDMDTVKSEVGTFMKVFPYGTIWNTSVRVGRGYDVVVLGQIGPLKLNVFEMIKRLNNQSKLQQSLQEVYLGTIPDLMWTYTGRGSELGKWLQGAQINHDMNLRLEYLAGFSLNVNKPTKIYLSMAKYRRYPEDIFGMQGTLPPIPGINR